MGIITLPWSMEQDRENQIKANSVHVDDNFNTLLTATNGKLEADGSIVPTANLPMGSHKITGLATPTNSGDAATKGYVDSRDNTLDATYVKLSGAQTIAGVKTFSSSPIVPTPTTNMQASTKKYVDDGLAGCVKTTGNQTVAGTKTFSGTIVASNKITGSISGNCDGNAGTVTNGVYTTGNQTIGGTKTFSGTLVASNKITGSISGNCDGNAGTVTNGVYTSGNQTIGGTKTFSSSPVAPTPASSDNSQKVATTAWVRGHGVLVSSQNPTPENSYKWSRVYSDGWVEQGQCHLTVPYLDIQTIALITPLRDTNYMITTSCAQINSNTLFTAASTISAQPKDASNFYLGQINSGGVAMDICWMAVGLIAL